MSKDLIKKYKKEFDHWLNEGKTIQIYCDIEKEWFDCNNVIKECGFPCSVENYRIKPDELKFNVGDWVRCRDLGKNEIIKITGEYYSLDDAYQCSNGIRNSKFLTLWKPEYKEYCWHLKTKQLIQVSLQKTRLYDAIGYTMHGFPLDIKFSDCEPFTEQLPSFLNDKEIK